MAGSSNGQGLPVEVSNGLCFRVPIIFFSAMCGVSVRVVCTYIYRGVRLVRVESSVKEYIEQP